MNGEERHETDFRMRLDVLTSDFYEMVFLLYDTKK